MANTIQIKRKTTTGPPDVATLADGEFCLVVPDEKLYQRVNGTTLVSWVRQNEYATNTLGGTVKMRIDGTDLYLTNNGSDA